MPYMLDNREKAWKIYDGEFGKKLGALTEKEGGWKWLGWAENSLRMFSNAKKEIKTPADMVGLKIRTQENDIHMKIVNDLGASATPIAFGELYTALQQGTVDGQENGVALTYSMGFAEIVKYMTLLPHIYDPYIVAISKESWNKLPPDLQKIFQECVNDFIKDERNLNAQNDKEYLEIMKKKNGLKTYTPTAEEAKLFKDATKLLEPMVRARRRESLMILSRLRNTYRQGQPTLFLVKGALNFAETNKKGTLCKEGVMKKIIDFFYAVPVTLLISSIP